jgi:hypothetical protein|tara:strand:- start:3617 stop:3883 length:267 start_codon:yes stop_codon:yes gene_type:complete
MKINTKYQIGDGVYVFNDNKLQKMEIKGIYVNVFTIYPKDGPQLKTEINYQLTNLQDFAPNSDMEGSVEEGLVYDSVENAKDNVVVEE